MEIEIGPHPDRLMAAEGVGFAADRAQAAPARVGAFVTETRVGADRHDWTVVVSDGHRWAVVHAWGMGIGRWTRVDPSLVARAVEDAVPRRVPERYRLEVFRHRGPVRITPSVLAAVQRVDGATRLRTR
jgi:hypothetical protein